MTIAPMRSDEAADILRTQLRELTSTRRHRETYVVQGIAGTTWTQVWRTTVPPLLVQLRYADAPGGGDRSGSGYESRPAASLECLDTLARIDLEVSRWVRRLGEDDPTSTVECLRRLSGLLPSVQRCRRPHAVVDQRSRRPVCCTWHAIGADVNRWWTQARVVTGWDSPAWRPDVSCPECGVRRSLRIRLSERVGFCVECHETWPTTAYQELADHVRLESELAASRARALVGPCWCVWPRPLLVGLAALCPRCGSASCRHAVRRAGERPS